jgi:hypothetical protein
MSTIQSLKAWNRTAANIPLNVEAFKALGVHPTDQKAQKIMQRVLGEALKSTACFKSLTDNPTVYFVYPTPDLRESELIGVFKLGEKRANIELAARQIAHLLGLGDYIVPGVFFGAEKLPFVRSDDLAVDLWNEKVKEYVRIPSDSVVCGILEPYEKSKPSESREDRFATLLLTALAIGLRDGREENMTPKIIDAEECMPNRIEAPEHLEAACAATHLPFISEYMGTWKNKVSVPCKNEMKKIVGAWDIKAITEEVSGFLIRFPDSLCEKSEEQDPFTDEGGCQVSINQNDDSDGLNDFLYTSKKSVNAQTPIFDENQIKAFQARLERLQHLIQTQDSFSPYDLIQAVDPQYIQGIALAEEISRLSSESCARPFSVENRCESIGRSSTSLVREGSVSEFAQATLVRLQAELDSALDAIQRLQQEVNALKVRRERHSSTSSSEVPIQLIQSIPRSIPQRPIQPIKPIPRKQGAFMRLDPRKSAVETLSVSSRSAAVARPVNDPNRRFFIPRKREAGESPISDLSDVE